MTELNAISLTTYISEDSEPSKPMIIRLFECLHVKTSLRNYSRVFRKSYSSTPLGVGKLGSRFSTTEEDRNKMNQNSHRILYGASTIETAVYEAIVRDRYDLQPVRMLHPENYQNFAIAQFLSESMINLLDLTRRRASRYGVPTNVIRSSDHSHGQHFSKFVYENMPEIDGFIYSSRFTEHDCVALFHDRAVPKLIVRNPIALDKNMLSLPMLGQNITVE